MTETKAEQFTAGQMKKDHYMHAHHIEVLCVKPDYAKLSMQVEEASLNGFGCVHGGIMFGLADTTAGAASFTDGRNYVTQNGDFHYISNISSGKLIAEGKVIHRGRTISTVEVKVFSEEGKLLGSGTYDMFAVKKQFLNV